MTSTHRRFITVTGAFETLGTGRSLAQEHENLRTVFVVRSIPSVGTTSCKVAALPSCSFGRAKATAVRSPRLLRITICTVQSAHVRYAGLFAFERPTQFRKLFDESSCKRGGGAGQSLELGPATFSAVVPVGKSRCGSPAQEPDLVRRAIVHEVAPAATFPQPPSGVTPLPALSPGSTDEDIVLTCKYRFRNVMNENFEAWDSLGEEYHRRLERNYVTWVRRYFGLPDMRMPTSEELQRRPVTWTIGGLTEAAKFFNNVLAAHAAGIEVGLLMCKHFPQVSIPEVLADHISKAARE